MRNYPQLTNIDNLKSLENYDGSDQSGYNLHEYLMGVDLFEPVFHYSLLTRATSYAILFIALTFMAMLIMEAYGQEKIHLVQYGIIGLGLCVFYLSLLALSEHIGFIWAYIISAAINILMIGGYVGAATKKASKAAVIILGQLAIYTILYFILNLEDYALLAGTALIVLATIALMVATRKLGHQKEIL